MKIIAIDSSGLVASVAIASDEELIATQDAKEDVKIIIHALEKELAELSEKSAAARMEFMEGRSQISDKIRAYISEYKKTEVIPLEKLTPLFTLGVSMLGEVPNDYYLNNYNYFFLGEEFGYKTMRLNLREYWFPDNYGVDSSFSFVLSDFIKSKSRGLVDFEDNRLHNLYYYSSNEIIYFSYDKIGFRPFCTFEGRYDEDFDDPY